MTMSEGKKKKPFYCFIQGDEPEVGSVGIVHFLHNDERGFYQYLGRHSWLNAIQGGVINTDDCSWGDERFPGEEFKKNYPLAYIATPEEISEFQANFDNGEIEWNSNVG